MKVSLSELVIGFIIIVGIAISGTKYFTEPEVIYHTEKQQEQIDSLSVALQNSRVTESDLRDSLESTTKGFQERLQRAEDEIISLTRINGRLSLENDSLRDETAVSSVSMGDICKFAHRSTISDSLILNPYQQNQLAELSAEIMQFPLKPKPILYKTTTFGDSLMSIYSSADIRNDSLVLADPKVRQLRPVKIDVAVTMSEDRRRVTSYVTSPDFDSLQVKAITPVEPKKRLPWGWIGLGTGFILGVVLN